MIHSPETYKMSCIIVLFLYHSPQLQSNLKYVFLLHQNFPSSYWLSQLEFLSVQCLTSAANPWPIILRAPWRYPILYYLSLYRAKLYLLPVWYQPDSQKGITEQATDKMDSMAGKIIPGVSLSFLSPPFTITNPISLYNRAWSLTPRRSATRLLAETVTLVLVVHCRFLLR